MEIHCHNVFNNKLKKNFLLKNLICCDIEIFLNKYMFFGVFVKKFFANNFSSELDCCTKNQILIGFHPHAKS